MQSIQIFNKSSANKGEYAVILWEWMLIPTGTQYGEDQISTNFHVISTYFFDVISLIEKSTSFPRTFFDIISMVEKSTLFQRTFFNVISFVEISTVFLLTFSSLFLWSNNPLCLHVPFSTKFRWIRHCCWKVVS